MSISRFTSSEVWHVGDDVSHCGLVGEGRIVISRRVYDRMIALTEAVSPSEWFGYVTGRVEGRKAMVTGLVIPRQTASGASAEPLEYPFEVKNIIGTVHSHGSLEHTGGFSGVDTTYSAANHRVSLLVGREFQGLMRVRTKCRRWVTVPARVEVARSTDRFVRENLSKIVIRHEPSYPEVRDAANHSITRWAGGRSLFDYWEEDAGRGRRTTLAELYTREVTMAGSQEGEAEEITAYKCPSCGALHEEEDEARDCCGGVE
jgi:hypothetical protein